MPRGGSERDATRPGSKAQEPDARPNQGLSARPLPEQAFEMIVHDAPGEERHPRASPNMPHERTR